MSEAERQRLSPPGGNNRVLLHSCCAPCSGEVMEAMQASGVDHSLRDANRQRKARGRSLIVIGGQFYGQPELDRDR